MSAHGGRLRVAWWPPTPCVTVTTPPSHPYSRHCLCTPAGRRAPTDPFPRQPTDRRQPTHPRMRSIHAPRRRARMPPLRPCTRAHAHTTTTPTTAITTTTASVTKPLTAPCACATLAEGVHVSRFTCTHVYVHTPVSRPRTAMRRRARRQPVSVAQPVVDLVPQRAVGVWLTAAAAPRGAVDGAVM